MDMGIDMSIHAVQVDVRAPSARIFGAAGACGSGAAPVKAHESAGGRRGFVTGASSYLRHAQAPGRPASTARFGREKREWEAEHMCSSGATWGQDVPDAPWATGGHSAKADKCKAFIERNRDQMHRFDPSYVGKSHLDCLDKMLKAPNFAATFAVHANKERALLRGNGSGQVRTLMEEAPGRTARDRPAARAGASMVLQRAEKRSLLRADPFGASLTTCRTARRADASLKFARHNRHRPQDNNRVRGNIPEYGSFARFTGMLQENQGAILNR